MIPRTRILSLVAVAACCLAGAGPANAAFEVKDEGKFFSADAAGKANQRIKEIKEQTGNDLLIETFAEIPADRKKDYKPERKDEFFARWARENARQRKVAGVYVLVCRDPAHLQIDRVTAGRAFPPADRGKLRDLLIARFKEKKFDEGLAEAVSFVAGRFKDNSDVCDDGGFFSADTMRKALAGIAEMRQRYGKDLVVETFKEIPAERKKDYKADDRNRFFEAWAKDRLKALSVDGIYVLVCREPPHLQVIVGDEARKKAFTAEDRKQLAELLLKLFRVRKYDEGLLEAVKLVEARLKANVGEKGSE
ncbi:MAG: TPM domain-containing protein [Planctomycetes bacterium]|nr:TPM domain-containing protein [Planctomycetota bacterium]